MNAYDNTLYVLTQGAYLAKDGERVLGRFLRGELDAYPPFLWR